jgi:hypothetical protein
MRAPFAFLAMKCGDVKSPSTWPRKLSVSPPVSATKTENLMLEEPPFMTRIASLISQATD